MISGFHPLKKTALGKRLRGLVMDISASENTRLLTVLLESEQTIINQCERNLPDFFEGLEETIEAAYERIKNAP